MVERDYEVSVSIMNYLINWDYLYKKNWQFFKSILIQANSISAKIAIQSLIWRIKHQRWCYWIYWPYVRDIRLTFLGCSQPLVPKARPTIVFRLLDFYNMTLLHHELLDKLRLSLQEKFVIDFFWSILIQANSISAKIAIQSLIWRSKYQWLCYRIYWPYVRDIRPTFWGVASL